MLICDVLASRSRIISVLLLNRHLRVLNSLCFLLQLKSTGDNCHKKEPEGERKIVFLDSLKETKISAVRNAFFKQHKRYAEEVHHFNGKQIIRHYLRN